MDEQSQPVAFANIILTAQQDSTMIKGTSTDDNGFFKLNALNKGVYKLKVSYIGYKAVLEVLTIDRDIDLGTITLAEEAQNLDEVSIVYKKPTLKKEADRLVFNVENTALVEGNMLQVLRSTPGVLVINDNITVKNTAPTVYINDRKVNLSASDLTQLLESSSANAIKSIEVITNPSAKYDASSGVVLNIVMGKNLITGYRGNVFANYQQGIFPIYTAGTGHFFKSEKVNFYANYNYTDSKENRDDEENINYFDDSQNTDQFWQSMTNRNKWQETHNFNMNFDYALNPKNTLSLASSLLFLPYYKYKKSNNTSVYDALNMLDFFFDSNNLERDKKHNLAFDLDFGHQFSKGELSLNTHFTDYDYRQNQDVISSYFQEDGSFIETTAFNTHNNQHTKIFAGKADYSLPVNSSSTFETGLKTSHVETNSSTARHDIINGQAVLDPNNTDSFDYKEDIYAAYANYSKDWEKWSVILGLRTEQTKIKSVSILNNQTDRQNYLEWFPTASISYKPSDKFSVYTNYKRSIERPDYQDLNPFRFYYNDNNVFVGNPNLKATITNHVVFGTSVFDHFTFEAYYKYSKNKIYALPRQDNATNTLLFMPLNVDKTIDYGFDFIVNFNIAKDWTVYGLTSFYNWEDRMVFDSNIVNQDQWSNYSELQSNIAFLGDRSLDINLAVTYFGKHLYGFRTVDAMWFSDLSISKSIMKKQAVISLSVGDLFNAQYYNYITRYLNQFNTIHTRLDDRFIKLGFRYNFGNTNLKTDIQTNDLKERERLKVKDN